MNDIQLFNNPEFGDVHSIEIDGKPYFNASDIATALGYSNPRDAIKRHCKGVVKADTPTNSGIQAINYIPQGDVFRLISRSNLPSAGKFESWVFDEVIPTIIKTGSYSVAPTPTALPMTTAEQIKLLAKSDTEIREDVENIKDNMSDMKSEIDTLKDTMPLFPADADLISEAVKRKGVDVLGGKSSEAYKDKGLKMSVFKDIYGQIHRNFGVKSYKSIRHKDCQNVLDVVSNYVLPLTLKDRIYDANVQLTFV